MPTAGFGLVSARQYGPGLAWASATCSLRGKPACTRRISAAPAPILAPACFSSSLLSLLMGLAAVAGTMSYRNWRKLSGASEVLRAEATERKAFMAWAGLFISFTLGVGIVWLCLPLFILQMCIRAR